jgi:site-specific DNA-methyltransferase (adenine-specific)
MRSHNLINADCTAAMRTMRTRSIDLILTDPPYITRYKSRDVRTVPNDDNGAWLE